MKPSIRSILNEIKQLKKKPLEDIEITVSEEDLTCVYAIITGPKDTPFEGGRFKIKLVLGNEFPKVPPKGYFITKIFHPNVAENGEICVNTLKRDWKETLGIQHIVITIKCLMIEPNPDSALNEDAGKLLLEEYETYFNRAKMYTKIHSMPLEKKVEKIEKQVEEEQNENNCENKQDNNQEISKNIKPITKISSTKKPTTTTTNKKKTTLKRL
eukprot:TRINITY_DN16115_c0_g1_i1.p1 TRINITY_DN16115_c0_g1~~TRINITY_DN16115_c0_g1_i1.p1  ORF type:complete len:213 (+),score=72.34 TRINITY_DN16115_c0_g1_i1:98-736(+)